MWETQVLVWDYPALADLAAAHQIKSEQSPASVWDQRRSVPDRTDTVPVLSGCLQLNDDASFHRSVTERLVPDESCSIYGRYFCIILYQ